MSFGPVSGLAVAQKALGSGSGGVDAGRANVYGTLPALRVTQVGAEVWGVNTSPPLRVTQLGAKIWGTSTSPPVHITQVGAEVWVAINQPWAPPAASAMPTLCVIT